MIAGIRYRLLRGLLRFLHLALAVFSGLFDYTICLLAVLGGQLAMLPQNLFG
jgi:hypothetical protein